MKYQSGECAGEAGSGCFIHHTAACLLLIYLFVLLKALEKPAGAQESCNKVENTCNISESVSFAPPWFSPLLSSLQTGGTLVVAAG